MAPAGRSLSASRSPVRAAVAATGLGPDAAGAVEGPLVVGLGDSVAAGTRAGGADYPALLVPVLERRTHEAVALANLAVPGLTSGALRAQLRLPGVRGLIRSATTTVVTIGANDLPSKAFTDPEADLGEVLAKARRGVRAALTALARIRPGSEAVLVDGVPRVSVTGYWNVGQDGPTAQERGSAYRARAALLTARVNTDLTVAARGHGFDFVPLEAVFVQAGMPLADDGDHPDARGQQLIADAIAAHWR